MFHTLAVKGQQGRIKVGYQTAATLGPYALSPSGPNEWTVEASVKSADAFWLTQGPQALEVSVGAQRWTWRGVSLVVADGMVRGTVTGKPDRR